MRSSIFLLLFTFSCVSSKNHVKSLTESMGQEVIEIGAPVKDLPAGLDEEPSAEYDQDDSSLATAAPPTKRETRKTSPQPLSTTTKPPLIDEAKEDIISQDEEERRIEKELAEIYKDTDYKSETKLELKTEMATTKEPVKKTTKTTTVKDEITLLVEKPVARQRANFKFQPDVNDRDDVERFRTSIDEISCERRVTQKLQDYKDSKAADRVATSIIIFSLAFVSILVCL